MLGLEMGKTVLVYFWEPENGFVPKDSALLIAPFLLHRSTLHCYSVPWQTAT